MHTTHEKMKNYKKRCYRPDELVLSLLLVCSALPLVDPSVRTLGGSEGGAGLSIIGGDGGTGVGRGGLGGDGGGGGG